MWACASCFPPNPISPDKTLITINIIIDTNKSYLFVYVIAQTVVKFGINFTSCSKNGNFAVIATTSGIYPKISLLPVLSQINTIASFFKSKYLIFKLVSTMSSGFLLLPARHDRSGLTFLCIGRRLTRFPAE